MISASSACGSTLPTGLPHPHPLQLQERLLHAPGAPANADTRHNSIRRRTRRRGSSWSGRHHLQRSRRSLAAGAAACAAAEAVAAVGRQHRSRPRLPCLWRSALLSHRHRRSLEQPPPV
jgi:hypothetical protein